VRELRSFCVTVEHLNGGLFWPTIEGAAGKHDVQIWLSTYGVPRAQVDAFGERCSGVLQRLFPRGAAAMKWILRLLVALVGLVVTVVVVLFLVDLRPSHGKNSATVEINRPAAHVWPYLTNDDLVKKWVSGLVEIQPLTRGEAGVGTRFRLALIYEGQRTEMELTLTSYQPNKRMGFTLKSLGDPSAGFTEQGEYVLVEHDGRTRLTLAGQSQYYGFMPRLFEPLITPAAQKKLEGDLARLKSLVEAEPPAANPTN